MSTVDRAALAAHCQAYGRWVEAEAEAEAEERMIETPAMLKTPSGYVQQSPCLSVANKQLELMGRFMSELGITPASRSRVRALVEEAREAEMPTVVKVLFEYADGVCRDVDGNRVEDPDKATVIPSAIL